MPNTCHCITVAGLSASCPKLNIAMGVMVIAMPMTTKAVADDSKAKMVFLSLIISLMGRPSLTGSLVGK